MTPDRTADKELRQAILDEIGWLYIFSAVGVTGVDKMIDKIVDRVLGLGYKKEVPNA